MKYNRMLELIGVLNEASKAYYQESREVMSNFEFDKLYDELLVLENELQITLASSPTTKVGYELLSELPKEAHKSPMLSLDKSKDVSKLLEFVGEQEVLLSWKLDGLTIVLTYRNGILDKAVTRGNGEIGEVITNNAKTFRNLPLTIPYKGTLTLRGEAVIGYKDFEYINDSIVNIEEKYKNPRNLCSGSVRQLNNEITAERRVNFFAFSLVEVEELNFNNSMESELKWLETQGFEIVEYNKVDKESLRFTLGMYSQKISSNAYPSDGLVLTYDNISYGKSLGSTAKFPRNAFAFKWEDEVKETTLLDIEWSASRTGLINPVAIFDSVELEGTTVSRASVHNLSIVEELELGIGDTISVYKANMIIPQIAENLIRSNNLEIPENCPVCQKSVSIQQEGSAKVLLCTNPYCEAKLIKSLALFVSRNALNIEGLSEASIEKFVEQGFLKNYLDIFTLSKHKDAIEAMEGFGVKSYHKLIQSIELAKITTLPQVIYALGIENVGLSTAKLICKSFHYDINEIVCADSSRLVLIEGVGPVIADTFSFYFTIPENKMNVFALIDMLQIPEVSSHQDNQLEGKVFVITGSVSFYKNRNEIKEIIENLGGKVTGSVSAKTDYLINNDIESSSAKNTKARTLDIPILSEEDFNKLIDLP